VHHREVTAPDVSDLGVTAPVANAGDARIVITLRDELAAVRARIESMKNTIDARTLEAERLRAWLVEILLKCKGTAPGLVGQAIYTKDWPRGRGPVLEQLGLKPEPTP
jgi:hypothetical protein